jgi:hypothetical protein
MVRIPSICSSGSGRGEGSQPKQHKTIQQTTNKPINKQIYPSSQGRNIEKQQGSQHRQTMAKSIRSKCKRKNRTEFRKTIGTVSVQLDREVEMMII